MTGIERPGESAVNRPRCVLREEQRLVAREPFVGCDEAGGHRFDIRIDADARLAAPRLKPCIENFGRVAHIARAQAEPVDRGKCCTL